MLLWLEGSGEAVFGWVVWMNIWCAGMLALAVVADRALARRVAPTWRMLLYAAVLMRLALPVSLESPIGLAGITPVDVRMSINDVGAGGSAEPIAAATTDPASRFAGSARGAGLAAAQVVMPLYGLGVAALALAWAAGARRMRRIERQARACELRLGSGGVPVLMHESAGPVLIGAWRPRLVIPRDLESRAGSTGLGWVLRHEAAHVARHDPITAAILHAVVIAAWPIVAVWLAAVRIRGLMEEACDDRALRGAGATERENYGRTLIELASSRPIAWLAPALPFGTALRSRVRALSASARWPVAAQAALVLALAAILVACTGSRSGGDVQARDNVSLMGAESEPFKGSLPIRVTILRSWPQHPKLDFALGQVRAGTPEPDWSIERVLTRSEFAEVLAGATAADAGAVLSRPRLEVVPGGKATISVGMDARNGQPMEGFTLDSTVTQVMIPAGADRRRVYTMDLDFARYGDARTASSARVRGVKVPQGETVALLATGVIGGERLLVCVSPGPDEASITLAEDGAAAQPSTAETRPLINFIVRIHRVDAPKDYGSPKGDGPRLKWSAYPGGAELGAAEFAAYQEELRGRAGYALLSAPQVWVYPDQEATLELSPEPDSPDAKQAIRLRGTPDGDAIRCTGSYSRSVNGMSTEGSWNLPKKLEPGGAMVWSIHDPELGAWYTVTIQANVRAPGTIKPQTATGLSPAR
jgi:beta-lactamase regulating signal transducer with metallopeptidase domain